MRTKRPRILRLVRVGQRRVGLWIDRRAGGEWHREIPSWGVSLLFHTSLLLMLALWLYVQGGHGRNDIEGHFAAQLTEDLTSLAPSDHAGDPFTKLKTDEPPSLSIVPSKPDETATGQPEVPNLAGFAPELAGPDAAAPRDTPQTSSALGATLARRLAPDVSSKALSRVVTRMHTEDMTAPFSGRGAAIRAKLVQREGGTVHSEKAVEMALDWLARHQQADGGWSLNFQNQCQGGGCPPGVCLESETAATGLALLPMLGAGHIHTEKTRYQPHVRQGLGWLTAHQQPNGDLYVGDGGMPHMYSHAIGAMALCEAYGLSHDPQLRTYAQRAIDFICQSQSPDNGGWRYTPGQSGDTSVFGWQMFALRSARLAGLRVPASVLKGCRTYLDNATADSKKITYSYMPGRGVSPVMTAEALLTRQYLGWPRNFPALVKGASMVATNLEATAGSYRNIYYWYYATQLLHNMQNKDWKRWNLRVRDGLVSMQTTGTGCDRGSWDPNTPQPDVWASTSNRHGAGRLYLTALSTLTLEVYYRYLPLYAPADLDSLKLDADTATADAKSDAAKPDAPGP